MSKTKFFAYSFLLLQFQVDQKDFLNLVIRFSCFKAIHNVEAAWDLNKL